MAIPSLRDEFFSRIRDSRNAEEQQGLWGYPYLSRDSETPFTTFSVETFFRLWNLEQEIRSVSGLPALILQSLRDGVQKFWRALRAKAATSASSRSSSSATGAEPAIPKRATALWDAAYAEFMALQQTMVDELLRLCSEYEGRSHVRVWRWQEDEPSTRIAVIQQHDDQRKSVVATETQQTVNKLERLQEMKRKESWNGLELGHVLHVRQHIIDEENVVVNLARLRGVAGVESDSAERARTHRDRGPLLAKLAGNTVLYPRSSAGMPLADISASVHSSTREPRAPLPLHRKVVTTMKVFAETPKRATARSKKRSIKGKMSKRKKGKKAKDRVVAAHAEAAAVTIQAHARAYLGRKSFRMRQGFEKRDDCVAESRGAEFRAKLRDDDATFAAAKPTRVTAEANTGKGTGKQAKEAESSAVRKKPGRELWRSFVPEERHRTELAQVREDYEKRIKVLERRLKGEGKRRKLALAKADNKAQAQLQSLKQKAHVSQQKMQQRKRIARLEKKRAGEQEARSSEELAKMSAALEKARKEGTAASAHSSMLEHDLELAREQLATATIRTAELEQELGSARQQLTVASGRSAAVERELETTRAQLQTAAARNVSLEGEALAAIDVAKATEHEAALQRQGEKATVQRVQAKRREVEEELECIKALLSGAVEKEAAKDGIIATLRTERANALERLAAMRSKAASDADASLCTMSRLEEQRTRVARLLQRTRDLLALRTHFSTWMHTLLRSRIQGLTDSLDAEQQRASRAVFEASTARSAMELQLHDAKTQLSSSIEAARAATAMAFEFDAVTKAQDVEIQRLRGLK